MAGHKGRALILSWGGSQIAGVREKSVELNGEPVDLTSDEDGGWRTLLEDEAAENQVNVSVSGVAKVARLKEDWFGNNRVRTLSLEYPSGDIISGEFMLTSYSETGPYNDATTFEATFQSTGVVTWTPYS